MSDCKVLVPKEIPIFELTDDDSDLEDFQPFKNGKRVDIKKTPTPTASSSSSTNTSDIKVNIIPKRSPENKASSATAWKDLMGLMQKNQTVTTVQGKGNKNKNGKSAGRGLKRTVSNGNGSSTTARSVTTGSTSSFDDISNIGNKDSESNSFSLVVAKKARVDEEYLRGYKFGDENNPVAIADSVPPNPPKPNFAIFEPASSTSSANSVRVFGAQPRVIPNDDDNNNCWNEEKKYITLNTNGNGQADQVKPGNVTKRQCPFYKKMPDTAFSVDAFNYGVIPGIDVYFLSHFHSDHYIGLTKKFSKTLICSPATGNLVKMKLGVSEECIRKLELDTVYSIQGTDVVLVDANHCPGSVMFIFRLSNGKIIFHTGDFRFTPDMLTNPFVKSLPKVDCLYLDTTYCDPKFDFPSQTDAIHQVLMSVKKHIEFRPQTLIVCGAYCIGKERVFFTLAEALKLQVFCEADKRRVIKALEIPDFVSLLEDKENDCGIHVLPMRFLNPTYLSEYLAARTSDYSNVIAIKPTGWEFSRTGKGMACKQFMNNTVTIIGVPYSEHSSFSELKEFVSTLRPIKVQPTVNVGSEPKRTAMTGYFNKWLGFNFGYGK